MIYSLIPVVCVHVCVFTHSRWLMVIALRKILLITSVILLQFLTSQHHFRPVKNICFCSASIYSYKQSLDQLQFLLVFGIIPTLKKKICRLEAVLMRDCKNFPVSSHGPTTLRLLIKSVSHLHLLAVIDVKLLYKPAVKVVVTKAFRTLDLDAFQKSNSLNHGGLNYFTIMLLYLNIR